MDRRLELMSARSGQVCRCEHFIAFSVNRSKMIHRTYQSLFISQAVYVHCCPNPISHLKYIPDKLLFHLSHFTLEYLDLPPTVQWLSIIHP